MSVVLRTLLLIVASFTEATRYSILSIIKRAFKSFFYFLSFYTICLLNQNAILSLQSRVFGFQDFSQQTPKVYCKNEGFGLRALRTSILLNSLPCYWVQDCTYVRQGAYELTGKTWGEVNQSYQEGTLSKVNIRVCRAKPSARKAVEGRDVNGLNRLFSGG